MQRLLLIFILTGLLSACGFYLKGQRPASASLQTVSVSYEQPYRVGDPLLAMALKSRLRAQDALVSSNAHTRIHISDVSDEANVLSVSPIDGRTSEIELISSVVFRVSVDSKPLLKDQSLSVQRSFSFDNTERLAAESEQADLLASMNAELADLILIRAETALSKREAVQDSPDKE